jgi:DNA polymerase III epsilon subunit-like protein
MVRTDKEKIEDRDGAIIIARQILEKPYSIIDTETTGVDEDYDQACQYARLDSDGNQFEILLKPTIHISDEASLVNNIFDKNVENALTADDIRVVGETPYSTRVLGWNVGFDINILKNSGRARNSNALDLIEEGNKITDIQWLYSNFIGYWHEECNRFGKIRLCDACTACGIEVDLELHNAMNDCIMTERILKYIANQKLSTE